VADLTFRAGTSPDRVKVEARSGSLFAGSHEIHTVPADFERMTPTAEQLRPTTKHVDGMIGADISFLPQIEDRAGRFFQGGTGFFENGQKDAGLGFLLDFHYSDYWADPQQQYKPLAWADLSYESLKDSVRSYTATVLTDLERQGTLPDMVQIGNEINHGILWPDGHIGKPDQLAGLLRAGVEGVEVVAPDMPVMMHVALGGQNDEARFWLDNMIARGVAFDVVGLSYYPRWHGTLEDLFRNVHDLAARYHKPIVIVEYSDFKREVADIVFGLPGDLGKGTAIHNALTPATIVATARQVGAESIPYPRACMSFTIFSHSSVSRVSASSFTRPASRTAPAAFRSACSGVRIPGITVDTPATATA
jgi:beta-galactosidase